MVRNNFIICRDGLIYFPDFCHFVLGKLREEERDRGEDFRQNMFKVSWKLLDLTNISQLDQLDQLNH